MAQTLQYKVQSFDPTSPGYSADVDGNGNKGWMLWESELGYHPAGIFNTHQLCIDGGTVAWKVFVVPMGSETVRPEPFMTGMAQTIYDANGITHIGAGNQMFPLAYAGIMVVITANGATPVLQVVSSTRGL